MKTPKVILKGLVSGRVKFTPELLEALKKLQAGKNLTETPCASFVSEHFSARLRRQRMIFASPQAGRWIRYSGWLLACASLLLPLLARAAGSDATFDEANRVFAAGNMSAAARDFQSVIARQGYSAPALFNLANAQFRNGQTGPAILNYERARWLAPNDPDIAANLDFARRKAGLPAETTSRLQNLCGTLSLNRWSALGATAMLMLAAFPLVRRLMPAHRFMLNLSTVGLGFVVLAAAVGVASGWTELDRAVITAPETAARVSPVTVVPPIFSLRAGETVSIKKLHGSFALITNGQGHEGWVSRDAVASIVPVSSDARL